MARKPALSLAEIREVAQRAADHIERCWPAWKKALSEPRVIQILVEPLEGVPNTDNQKK
jgi:hypothetical protein